LGPAKSCQRGKGHIEYGEALSLPLVNTFRSADEKLQCSNIVVLTRSLDRPIQREDPSIREGLLGKSHRESEAHKDGSAADRNMIPIGPGGVRDAIVRGVVPLHRTAI